MKKNSIWKMRILAGLMSVALVMSDSSMLALAADGRPGDAVVVSSEDTANESSNKDSQDESDGVGDNFEKDESETGDKSETKDESETGDKSETKDESEAEDKSETKDESGTGDEPGTKDESGTGDEAETKDESETDVEAGRGDETSENEEGLLVSIGSLNAFTSAQVTASFREQQVSGDYHDYYITVSNQSSDNITDWIVQVSMSGVYNSQDWSKEWANVQAYYTNDYLYIAPKAGYNSINAGASLGGSDNFRFNYKGPSAPTNSKVYYFKDGSSSFASFISELTQPGETEGSGGSSGGSGSGGSFSDTTKNLGYTDIEYNYAKLLQESLYFYDANMCGDIEGKCALNWRKNCHLSKDSSVTYKSASGKNYTVNVSGGFHDAGDHDKFGLPQGYAATMLGITYYEYTQAFTDIGEKDHLKRITDHFCEYFKRCTVLDESGNAIAFCYQVGNGDSHNYWVSPESENIDRPAYFADSRVPATDQVSEAAAALAINYINFGNAEDLVYAKKLFAMAKANNKAKQNSAAGDFYKSSAWEDDYCLAAALLYKATKDESYKTEYNNYASKIESNGSWPSWDSVPAYARYYGAGDVSALSEAAGIGINGCTIKDNGYAYLAKWASARYNCNIQALGLLYDKLTGKDSFTSWARGQMNFLLGNNKNKQCFVVGYNQYSSKCPHHRGASGYSGFPDQGYGRTPAKNVLLGALVGGIGGDGGNYTDDASDYYWNEVALDYNAGLVGSAVALYLAYKSDSTVPKKILTKAELASYGVIEVSGSGSGGSGSGSGGETNVAVTGVSLNKTSATIKKGESITLTATVKPDNATEKTVTWSSSDESIATVDSTGKVTGVKAGSATIKATSSSDASKSASCVITVAIDYSLTPFVIDLSKLNDKDYMETLQTKSGTEYKNTVAYDESTKTLTLLLNGTYTLTGNAPDVTVKCDKASEVILNSASVKSIDIKGNLTVGTNTGKSDAVAGDIRCANLNGKGENLNVGGSINCTSINIESGTITVNKDVNVTDDLLVNGGTLNVTGKTNVTDDLTVNGGSLNLTDVVTVGGDMKVTGGNVKTGSDIKVTGTYTQTNGDVNVNNGNSSLEASEMEITGGQVLGEKKTETRYTVTLDAGIGTIQPATYSVTSQDRIVIPSPSYDGTDYEFVGWFTQSASGTKVTEINNIKSDVTFYARWQEILAQPVISPANGSEISADDVITLTTSTKNASIYYTFDSSIGANLSESNGTAYSNGIYPAGLTGTITIYAVTVKTGCKNSNVVSATYVIKKASEDTGDIINEDLRGTDGFGIPYDYIANPETLPEGLWVAGICPVDYTGKAITFSDMHVYFGKTLLKAGTDYAVAYSANKKAGKARITITGKGNYRSTKVINFAIVPRSLESEDLFISEKVAIKESTVKAKAKANVMYRYYDAVGNEKWVTLAEGVDFTYDYSAVGVPSVAGQEYTVTIKGIGNYKDTATFTEQIIAASAPEKKNISSLVFKAVPVQKADGTEKCPELVIKNKIGDRISNDNFDFEYKNNVAAGVATVIVKARETGDYAGTKTVTFQITGIAMANVVVNVKNVEELTYDGTKKEPSGYILKYNGEALELHRDYEIFSIKSNVNAGTALTVTFIGKGRFVGKISKNFSINRKKLNDLDVTFTSNGTETNGPDAYIGSFAYTKNGVKPGFEIRYNGNLLVPGKDYSVIYKNNTNAGGSQVPLLKVTGIGNYTGTIKRTFTITKSNLSVVNFEASDIIAKNIKGICKPVLKIKDANNKSLVAGIDYNGAKTCYTYANSVDVKRKGEIISTVAGETAVDLKNDIIPEGAVIRVTIFGKGNYDGSTYTEFRFVGALVNNTEVIAKAKTYNGKFQELSEEDITVSLKNGKKLIYGTDYIIINYKKNKDKGTASAVVLGIGRYGGRKAITFNIRAKAVDWQ